MNIKKKNKKKHVNMEGFTKHPEAGSISNTFRFI